jgi:colicin import membrane protein
MQSSSTNAFFLSTLLHGSIAALILFSTYACQQRVKDPPKIFELVQGEGDNYAATVAPALGTPNAIKIAMPEPPAPAPVPTPLKPEVSPVTPAPEPVIEKAPPEKPIPAAKPTKEEPPLPNISRQIKNKLVRADAKAKAEVRKEREAEQKRVTKEEFDRANKAKAARTASAPTKVTRIDAEGIRQGVVGGSTANKTGGAGGKALAREEADALDAYFSLLKRRLKEALEKPPGLSDTLIAVAEVRIGADGTLSGARIKQSSGSAEFDHAVLEAIARVRSVGSRPDGRSEVLSIPFRMKEEDEG